jgi:hypothetical protein
MNAPTAAPRAARNPVAPPQGPCFPPLTLVPARPAASAGPRRFTAQVTPLVYRSLPLPSGLDDSAAERYVRAFAQGTNQDCCVEYAGSRAVYFLADGTRFEAGR